MTYIGVCKSVPSVPSVSSVPIDCNGVLSV